MQDNNAFNACRVCLFRPAPNTLLKFSSLFDGDGQKAAMFQLVSDIYITDDIGKYQALICEECLLELEEKNEFVLKIRSTEVNYIQIHEENSDAQELGHKFCRVCRTQANANMENKVDDESKWIAMFQLISGIKLEKDFGSFFICEPKCRNELRHAHNFRKRIIGVDKAHFQPQRVQQEKRFESTAGPRSGGNRAPLNVVDVKQEPVDIAAVSVITITSEKERKKLLEKLNRKAINSNGSSQTTTAFKCLICDKIFLERSSVRNHVLKVHFMCEKTLQLEKHVVSSHAHQGGHCDRPLKPDNVNINTELKRNKNNSQQFKRIGKKAFKCSVCKKVTATKGNMVSHIRSIHEKTKFSCPICSKLFRHDQYLITHVDTVHNKIKRFSCDLCFYTTFWKHAITSHLMHTHINPTINSKPYYFKCEFRSCLKFFKTKYSLERHQRSHSGN